MPRSYSAALPVAYVLLRVLVVLNLLFAIAVVVVLVALPTEEWIISELNLRPSSEADRVVMGLHTIAVLGLITVPLNHLILTRLLAIVRTVRIGDPFIAANAYHLNAIAWALLALQLMALVIGAISDAISTKAHPIDLDAGFSVTGWLAVLLMFVLARVFAEGALMRDDLEGTV